jgi:hypothetical protein
MLASALTSRAAEIDRVTVCCISLMMLFVALDKNLGYIIAFDDTNYTCVRVTDISELNSTIKMFFAPQWSACPKCEFVTFE